MAPKTNPLPFSETLRDLALLRASDLDFTSILSSVEEDPSSQHPSEGDVPGDVRESVQRSYDFVHESRAALKILNRNEVEREGLRVDDVRSRIEDVLEGLDSEEGKR